jgi:hypothetical protein
MKDRLILIGNGFDIAHKIKTSYKDFILDYLKTHLTRLGNMESTKMSF